MTEPLPLPTVMITYRWSGLGAPQVGHFLRSEVRPRYAYQIVKLHRLGVRLNPDGSGTLMVRAYRLTCARWRAADVPRRATVLRIVWDKR